MRQEDILRMQQRNEEEQWRAINEINRRLDYIEPREQSTNPLLLPPGSSFAYGELYANDNVVNQVVPAGAGYTKVTLFLQAGLSRNAFNDIANDQIVLSELGRYKVDLTGNLCCGTANTKWWFAAFVNGVKQKQIENSILLVNANRHIAICFTGFMEVTDALFPLDLRVRHDGLANRTLGMEFLNMNCIFLSGLLGT